MTTDHRERVADELDALISLLEQVETPAALPLPAVQRLLGVAIRCYAAAVDVNGLTPAFPSDLEHPPVTATEAVIAVSGILKELNIELFELAMWQTSGGPMASSPGTEAPR